jgi:hypothetical protein
MSPRSPTELVLKITLRESEPPIWRRVAVPDDLSLARLHDVIQIAMGWMDCHLHEFHVGDRTYGIPDPDFEDLGHRVFKENNCKLASLVGAGVDRFDYVYDFGDNWVHEVVIESAGPLQHDRRYPSFIDGARRCPPEDVGGIGGYFEYLHAIADPTHEDHEQMLTWVGGAYDPETFDRHRIQLSFDMMANRSRAPWRRMTD